MWLPSHFPPVPFVPHALCHQYAPPLETVFQKDLRLKVNICGNFGIRSYVSKYWGFNIKTLRSREIKKGLKECFGNYCCSVDFDDAKLVPWGERQLLRLTPTLENRIGFQSVSLKPCLKYNGLGLYHKNNRQNDTVYQDENLMLNTERVYICGHFGICSYVKLRRFQSQNLEIQRDVGEN